ncbi:MAG: hypothetical protein ACYC7E_22705 [Armatimonadota bacterium]
MIEFTCSLNVLLGLASASSANGVKQRSANAAVHIRRGERCLQFAAQNGRLTVLHQIADKSDALPEVCWTDEEESIVSLPLRTIAKELQGLPKMVVVSIGYTRCEITPVKGDKAKGAWCERWRVPTQHTLFPDLTRLPKPSPNDLRLGQGMTPDLATIALLQKTAKKLGAGSTQPTFSFFGETSVESIGVKFPDLTGFYAVMKALPYDTMDCEPPAWLVDRDALPGVSSLSSVFFRTLSEAEKAEREAEAEPPKETKKRGRKPKAMPGQTVLGAPTPEEIDALTDEEVYQRYSNAGNDNDRATYAAEWKRRQGAKKDAPAEEVTVRPLEWMTTYDDEDCLILEATSIWHDGGSPFHYRIKACEDLLYRLISDPELLPVGEPRTFSDLDEAKLFCQECEDEAIAALSKEGTAPTFDEAAVTPPEAEPVELPRAVPDGEGVTIMHPDEEPLYVSLEDFGQHPHLPTFLAAMTPEHLQAFMGLAERAELVFLQEQIRLEGQRREALCQTCGFNTDELRQARENLEQFAEPVTETA